MGDPSFFIVCMLLTIVNKSCCCALGKHGSLQIGPMEGQYAAETRVRGHIPESDSPLEVGIDGGGQGVHVDVEG